MHRFTLYFSFLLVALTTLPAACDDQQKAQGLLNKVSAMAADSVAKRAVSLATAEILSVERLELVRRRRELNVTYGDIFLLYQLVKGGATMDGISAQLKNGRTMWQIAREAHLNWKDICLESKRLNSRVDATLLKQFANGEAAARRDQAARYDPFLDSVKADANVSQHDLEDAQNRYLFLRDHSRETSDSMLDTSTERSARMVRTDPVRTGGPSNPDTSTHPK